MTTNEFIAQLARWLHPRALARRVRRLYVPLMIVLVSASITMMGLKSLTPQKAEAFGAAALVPYLQDIIMGNNTINSSINDQFDTQFTQQFQKLADGEWLDLASGFVGGDAASQLTSGLAFNSGDVSGSMNTVMPGSEWGNYMEQNKASADTTLATIRELMAAMQEHSETLETTDDIESAADALKSLDDEAGTVAAIQAQGRIVTEVALQVHALRQQLALQANMHALGLTYDIHKQARTHTREMMLQEDLGQNQLELGNMLPPGW